MATISTDLSRTRIAPLVVLFVAAALYLSLLGSKSLWFDETFSVSYAQAPDRLWEPSTARPETHPPLYYYVLHHWMNWFGDGETAVRLPSAFVSIINVALIYVLGKRLFNQRAALIAATLLALSPLHLWYAQEARMYIFMTTVTLLAAVLLTWNSWWTLLPLAVTFGAGLYIDYTMLPIWILLSALWLVWWWNHGHDMRQLSIWALASLIAWLLFLPWLSNFYDVIAIFNDIHIFLRLHEMLGIPFFSPEQYLLILFAGGALLVPAAWMMERLQLRPDTRPWLAAIVVGGFLAATLLFPLPRLYGLKRLIIQVWPLIILWVAWALSLLGTKNRWWIQAMVVVSLVASLVALLGVPKDDWRGAVHYVNGRATADDRALLSPPWNTLAVAYYDLAPPATIRRENLEQVPGDGIVWFFAERFPGEPVPSTADEAFLDDQFRLVEEVPFYRLEVRGYRKVGQ